ncbi:MAG TPA: hypothetical protein PLR76_06810 [Hyphomonas sp.]|nr:hypothetical protein [Hyphomonas sp.]
MILRRITNAFSRQDWFTVFIETLIVVLGVFLGLQVNNWNAGRANRAMETTYLELLRRDLRTIVVDLENQIEFEQFQVRLANDAVSIIEQPPSELRKKQLGMTLTQLGARRTMRIDSPTFLDLQGSGRLGLVSDPDLRSAILSYFFGMQRWEAVIDKNNEFFVDNSFNTFTDDLSVGYWFWDEDVMNLTPPAFVSLILKQRREGVDPRLLEAGGAVLQSPPDAAVWDEVRTRLGKRASIAIANESIASNVRDEAQAVEKQITAYLEARN